MTIQEIEKKTINGLISHIYYRKIFNLFGSVITGCNCTRKENSCAIFYQGIVVCWDNFCRFNDSGFSIFNVANFDAFDFEWVETFTTDAIVVLLPFLSNFEDSARLGRVLATANLFGAIDGGLAVGLLRTLTHVTIICIWMKEWIESFWCNCWWLRRWLALCIDTCYNCLCNNIRIEGEREVNGAVMEVVVKQVHYAFSMPQLTCVGWA